MNTMNQIYKLFLEHPFVSTDTRNIIPNSIFFALKGENFNGNKFAIDALNKGASWAICDEQNEKHDRIILVDDVLKTLQGVAKIHRESLSIPIIGITGTNGKTTTKELLFSVLSSNFNVQATKGNLNNHIGVPLTILSITALHQIAIVEMGANHIGEIAELCEIAQPTHGIITNIGKAHLEGFGSIEGVIKTKKALYDFINRTQGTLFVDSDSTLLLELSEGIKKQTYGTQNANIQGEIINITPHLSLLVNHSFAIESNLVGGYNLKNILAAVCVGTFFKIEMNDIAKSIKEYHPTNNRSQFIESKTNKIILDAYNANPSSMTEALCNINNIEHHRKVLILGDMLELGAKSLEEHRVIIEKISETKNILTILVGSQFMESNNNSMNHCFVTVNEAIEFIKQNPISNSLILIKGSRGIKMESVLPYVSI